MLRKRSPSRIRGSSRDSARTLDLAHAPIGALRHAPGPPHEPNRGEHTGDVVGVQREDLRAAGEPEGGGLGVARRHRAHLAHTLCEEQIGPDGGQPLAIDLVDAAELAERLPYGGVDLAARTPVQEETRPDEARLTANLWGMIAGMRDTDEVVLEAERAHDLRRAGEERDDPRRDGHCLAPHADASTGENRAAPR